MGSRLLMQGYHVSEGYIGGPGRTQLSKGPDIAASISISHYSIFTSDSFRWPVYCNTSAGAKCSSDCDQTPAGPWPSSESDAGRRSQVAGAAHLRTGHGRAEMRPGVNCKVQCICMTYSMYYTYTYTTGYAILAVASASRSGEHVDRAA